MIGVYIRPESMTREQYDAVDAQIKAAGIEPKGLKLHTLFGEAGSLAIFDVWESEADFQAFATQLGPMMASSGVKAAAPDIVPMHIYEVS